MLKQTDSKNDLLEKISYIQNVFDPSLRLTLDSSWCSSEANHRQKIREYLSIKFSTHFSRQQLVLLNDLNWIPKISDGHISITHCKAIGGFSFSDKAHGFDSEELKRISVAVLKRTSSELEYVNCPKPEFLWCAKEAAFKAFSQSFMDKSFLISHFVCRDWEAFFENKIFKFKLAPIEGCEFLYNQGYVFSFDDVLYAIYYL